MVTRVVMIDEVISKHTDVPTQLLRLKTLGMIDWIYSFKHS